MRQGGAAISAARAFLSDRGWEGASCRVKIAFSSFAAAPLSDRRRDVTG